MENDTQPQPAPEKVDGRKHNGKWHSHNGDPKPINGAKLMPKVVEAALGARSFNNATAELSHHGRKYLRSALKQDVDQWRSEFAGKLRAASEELLELTVQELESIPPAARAYTLAVLVDKAQVLEGKTAMAGANVNVQINNYGDVSKSDLIKRLHGEIEDLPQAQPVDDEQK